MSKNALTVAMLTLALTVLIAGLVVAVVTVADYDPKFTTRAAAMLKQSSPAAIPKAQPAKEEPWEEKINLLYFLFCDAEGVGNADQISGIALADQSFINWRTCTNGQKSAYSVYAAISFFPHLDFNGFRSVAAIIAQDLEEVASTGTIVSLHTTVEAMSIANREEILTRAGIKDVWLYVERQQETLRGKP